MGKVLRASRQIFTSMQIKFCTYNFFMGKALYLLGYSFLMRGEKITYKCRKIYRTHRKISSEISKHSGKIWLACRDSFEPAQRKFMIMCSWSVENTQDKLSQAEKVLSVKGIFSVKVLSMGRQNLVRVQRKFLINIEKFWTWAEKSYER